MRNAIIHKISELLEKDDSVFLLTADLWYSVLDEVLEKYPNRCLNVGIAEQNMIGIAAGLALSWKKVFCYSIVPFVTMRCYEQIRIDICSHNLDVTLIGIGWGFAYGTLWNTHYGIEDINIMRWLPNMRIFSPADKIEMQQGLEFLLKEKCPTYIRLNRGGENNLYTQWEVHESDIKNGVLVHRGTDICIFTTGNISLLVKECVVELEEEYHFSIKIVSIPLLKPIANEAIIDHMSGIKKTLSIEEHSIIWGLGSAIAEIIAENNISTSFKRIGIQDSFFYTAWNQDTMREIAWIWKKEIKNEIIIALQS